MEERLTGDVGSRGIVGDVCDYGHLRTFVTDDDDVGRQDCRVLDIGNAQGLLGILGGFLLGCERPFEERLNVGTWRRGISSGGAIRNFGVEFLEDVFGELETVIGGAANVGDGG